MASLILPSRFNRQPSARAVIADGALSSGLVLALNFAEGLVDHVTGRVVENKGTGEFSFDSLGRCFTPADAGINVPWDLQCNEQHSIVVVERRFGYSLGDFFLCDARAGASGYIYGNTSTIYEPAMAYYTPTGVYDSWGSGYQVKTFTRAASYQNAAAYSANTSGTGLSLRSNVRFFGRYTDSNPYINGKIAALYVFNRNIGFDEHLALFENPWQVFKPRKSILYFDVGGGSGSTATPDADLLVLTPASPTASATNVVSAAPGADELALSAHAPTSSATASVTASPGIDQLALTTAAPAVLATASVVAAPGSAQATFTALAPSIAVSQNASISVGSTSTTVTGTQPDLLLGGAFAPGIDALVITGEAPATARTLDVQPASGAVELAGLAPGLSVTAHATASPGVDTLAITGSAPTPTASQTGAAYPGVGSLAIVAAAPAVSSTSAVTVQPAAGVLAISGQAPSTQISVAIPVSTRAVTITGIGSTLLVGHRVTPGSYDILTQGLQPIIGESDQASIAVPETALQLTTYDPQIVGTPVVVEPGAGEVIIDTNPPSAWQGVRGELLGTARIRTALGAATIRVR